MLGSFSFSSLLRSRKSVGLSATVLLALSSAAQGDGESGVRRHYDAAYQFLSSGKSEQADSEFKLFLTDALRRVANGRANSGEYARAVPVYDQALKLAPDNFPLHLDYAGAALDANDVEKARTLAQSGLNLNAPDASNAQRAKLHLILGQTFRGAVNYKQAVEQMDAAAVLEPNFDNLAALGEAYLVLADKPKAGQVFAQMVTRFGDRAEVHLAMARAYERSDYRQEAAKELKHAIAENDRLPTAHSWLGASYILDSGESAYTRAEAEFRKELVSNPNDSYSYTQLGRIALSRHCLSEAERDLKRANELNPRDLSTLTLLAQLYVQTKRTAEAEAALRKALATSTGIEQHQRDYQRAHYQLGRLLIQHGRTAEGEEQMKLAASVLLENKQKSESEMKGLPADEIPLSKTPVRATAADIAAARRFEKELGPLIAGSYSNLGVHAAMRANYDPAEGYFEQSAAWDPALPGLDHNWGRAAFASHHYAAAEAPLSRYLKTHPDEVEARSMLGMSQYMTSDYAKVLLTLHPIEEQVNAVPALAFAYADSMVKTGKLTQGIELLRVLIQSDPRSAQLHHALAEAYRSNLQNEDAERESRLYQLLAAQASR